MTRLNKTLKSFISEIYEMEHDNLSVEEEIKKIISEELDELITEYGNEEIINPETIDLQQEYDELNQKIFDNELPRIPLVWSRRKGALGHVKAMINRATGEIKISKLATFEFYEK